MEIREESKKHKRTAIRVNDIVNFLFLYGQLFFCIMYLFVQSTFVLNIRYLIGIVTLIYYYAKSNSVLRNRYVICFLLTILLMLGNVIVIGNYEFIYIFIEIALYFGLALMIAQCNHSTRTSLIAYIIYVVFLWSRIFSVGYPYNTIFLSSSRNYVSITLFFMMLPYYAACSKEKKSPSFLVPLCSFVTSSYVLGRGGIITTGLLIVLTCVKNITLSSDKKTKRRYVLIGILVIASSVIIVRNTDFIAKFFFRFSQEGYLIDASRNDMISDYFRKMVSSPIYFVFGVPKSQMINFGNAHNTFLMVHRNSGILGLVITTVLITKSIKSMISHKDYDLFILSICILARSLSDWMFPNQLSGVMIWFLIIYALGGFRRRTNTYTQKDL